MEKKKIDQNEFLIQHLTEGKSYKQIVSDYDVKLSELQNWWESGTELRNQIKRSNILFASKKSKPEFVEFGKAGQRKFFEWFRKQLRSCSYCGIEEEKLQKIFDYDTGILKSKRGRGRSLELERRDSESNLYSEQNCVLACYFCNNHKSDILTEAEHKKYFAANIWIYLEDKYNELTNRDNG